MLNPYNRRTIQLPIGSELKSMQFHGWVTFRHSMCSIPTTVPQFSSPIGSGLKGMEFHEVCASRMRSARSVTQFSSPIGSGLKGMEFHGSVTRHDSSHTIKSFRSCQKLPRAAGSCREVAGVARSCQELPAPTTSSRKAARSCWELLGPARSCQEL